MNKIQVKITLCASVIIMLLLSNNAIAVKDSNGYAHNTKTTQNTLESESLIDTEIMGVPNMLFHFAPYTDYAVGISNVRGSFLAFNSISTVTLLLHFQKRIPLGLISFDLLCTHIHIKVVDLNDNTVTQYNLSNPNNILFFNNWHGAVTLPRPMLLPYHFFYLIVIEIYGRYDYTKQ